MKTIIVELYDGDKVHIAEESSSGCEYKNIHSLDELLACFKDYIENQTVFENLKR